MSAEPSAVVTVAGPAHGLTLAEAATRCCTPRLVREHQDAFDCFRSFLIGGAQVEWPNTQAVRQQALLNLMLGREAFASAVEWNGRALRALEQDFRRRISAGTVLVWGVQVEPALHRHRIPLASDWGDALVFAWENNAVVFGKYRFASVICAVGPGPKPLVPALPAAPKRPTGRPIWPMAEFIDIARGRQRQSPNQREAGELLAIFRKRHPDLTPPAEHSIKIRLGMIYRAAKQLGEQL